MAKRRKRKPRLGEIQNTPSGGPATDARGIPVIDPTANVLAVVKAAVERQDDLREAYHERLKDMADLRSHYEELLRIKESQRIDAIRTVDTEAVKAAALVQSTVAQALQTQVATTAQAAIVALDAALTPMRKDIAELRQVQYQQQGQRVAAAESHSSDRETKSVEQWLIGVVVAGALVVTEIVLHFFK